MSSWISKKCRHYLLPLLNLFAYTGLGSWESEPYLFFTMGVQHYRFLCNQWLTFHVCSRNTWNLLHLLLIVSCKCLWLHGAWLLTLILDYNYNVQLCWRWAGLVFCDKVWSWGGTNFEIVISFVGKICKRYYYLLCRNCFKLLGWMKYTQHYWDPIQYTCYAITMSKCLIHMIHLFFGV